MKVLYLLSYCHHLLHNFRSVIPGFIAIFEFYISKLNCSDLIHMRDKKVIDKCVHRRKRKSFWMENYNLNSPPKQKKKKNVYI